MGKSVGGALWGGGMGQDEELIFGHVSFRFLVDVHVETSL